MSEIRSMWQEPRRRVVIAVCVAAIVLVAGLVLRRSHLPPGHVRVTGSFEYEDGARVAGLIGVVRFDPEETYTSGVRGACTGNLASNGNFELMTRESGDGVAVGDYRVVLMALKPDGGQPERIHDDYTHFETTPLRAHVSKEAPNSFKFVLDDPSRRPTTEYHPTRRAW